MKLSTPGWEYHDRCRGGNWNPTMLNMSFTTVDLTSLSMRVAVCKLCVCVRWNTIERKCQRIGQRESVKIEGTPPTTIQAQNQGKPKSAASKCYRLSAMSAHSNSSMCGV